MKLGLLRGMRKASTVVDRSIVLIMVKIQMSKLIRLHFKYVQFFICKQYFIKSVQNKGYKFKKTDRRSSRKTAAADT